MWQGAAGQQEFSRRSDRGDSSAGSFDRAIPLRLLFPQAGRILPENPTSIWRLPRGLAVYALYGGGVRDRDLAYIGVADILVRRVVEQLVVRDPLLLAESPVVALLPFYVSEIRWWSDPSFGDGNALHAAELVACDLLDPPLRGRSRTSARVFALYEDARFRERMEELFRSAPGGRLLLPTQAHALEWLAALELRVKALEQVREAGARSATRTAGLQA
jgi:hypothetical protein